MRRGIILLVLIGVCLIYGEFLYKNVDYLIEVKVPHKEVYKLSPYYTVVDAGEDFIRMVVNEEELGELRAWGYDIKILVRDYAGYKRTIWAKGFYHTYAQVCDSLINWASRYSSICRLDTIGFSVRNRAILALRVTDNPRVEELEPEIRFIGSMHGDEKIGCEIVLFFGHWILSSYATDPLARALVNNREIWVIPIYNVDGHIADTRQNANGVDLNRDCGYMNGRVSGSSGPWSQIESQLFLRHAEQNNLTLEYNYHSAAQYVNYLWDFHPVDPPDSTLIIPLSRIYADTTRLTPINGYDWYQIYSSLQDADFGIFGTISTTIETPEPSGSAEIDTICIRNMRAMRNVAMRAGWGLRGQVRDSLNNRPLSARIEFVNPLRWSCYTDPDSGDFHKMLASGTYTIKVCANGYRSKIVSNIVVPPDSSIWLNVLLSPDQTYRYPFKFAWTVYADSFERIVPRSFYALGDSDGFYHSLGKSGDIALDMGLTPLINGPGVDFRVIEGNDGTAEGYRVYASNGWNGPWTLCGADTGSGDFSLPGSLPSARYIRITDDGDGQANSPTAGFDLDALKPLHFSSVEEQIITRLESSEPCLSVYPNPFRFKTEIKFSVGSRTKDRVLNIYDATGRLARSFCFISSGHCPATSLNWDGTDEKGRQLPGGVYFVEFKTENGRISEKLIRLR